LKLGRLYYWKRTENIADTVAGKTGHRPSTDGPGHLSLDSCGWYWSAHVCEWRLIIWVKWH